MYVDKETFQQIHELWGSMVASTSVHFCPRVWNQLFGWPNPVASCLLHSMQRLSWLESLNFYILESLIL